MRQQVGNELKAFVGSMRRRRKAQIDQCQFGWGIELTQQALDLRARRGGTYGILLSEYEAQRVNDQRIVIDDQQFRLGCVWCVHVSDFGSAI